MPSVRILGGSILVVVVALIVSGFGAAERPELVETTDGPATASRTLTLQVVDDGDGLARTGGFESQASSARASVDDAEGDASSTRAEVASAAIPVADGVPLVALDTDMGPDIDDALALAMLHTYQARGQAEIAAVTLSRNSATGARFIDAYNTWSGHPDIPVGIDRRSPYSFNDSTSYVALAGRWPNDVADRPIDDGVTVLRTFLARAIAEGRPAVLIQVGFSGNTAALLDSGPDDVSPLSGRELVLQSNVLLSMMAGSIPDDRVEFNVANDVAAARQVINGWPGDLVLSPFELGYDIHYPYSAIAQRLPGGGSHLLREAYQFRDYSWHVDAPPYYDMRTWDLTSVMHGVERDAGWYPLSGWGRVTIDERGRTFFVAGEGRHRYLDRSAMSGDALSRARSEMIDLVSSAPTP
ncbi:MAG: nucleoside hydrolase [Actinomycetota bacterium]